MSQSFPITIVMQNDSNLITSFYVQHNQSIAEIKAVLEAQWGLSAASFTLHFNGRPLNDTDCLNVVGVRENDLLQAATIRQQPPMPQSSGESMMMAQVQSFKTQIRNNVQLQDQLRRTNPMLLQAALGDTPGEFENLMLLEFQRQAEAQQRLAALDADPLNEENQRLIEQEIRQANIQRNYEAAMEHNPEASHQVCMLYVNLRLGSKQATALVDSGAQSTVMSLQCAERLGILHLLDRRFKGVVRGVGTSNIAGRIHYVEVQLGSHYLAATLTVIDGLHIDFLWGLDMLRKHRMCIDLEKDCLRIGEDEVPFIKEHELPESVMKFEEEQKSASGTPTAARSSIFNPPVSTSSQPSAEQLPVPATNSGDSNQVNEQDINTLMGLGFNRTQAINALQSCNGNVELAAGMLFH